MSGCAPSVEPVHPDQLWINASVVDVVAGRIIPDQYIAFQEDTISSIGHMSALNHRDNVRIVDAEGKFVMPGLWDNHVHFRGGDSLIDENRNLLPLFLAYGITTVRDAGGDISTNVLKWKNDILSGNLAGPYIFTSGPKLDGSSPAWPGSIPLSTAGDINLALDSLEELGVDYVKLYDGNLSAELFYKAIEAAEERGLKVTGHMPMTANLLTAAALGLDGTEHLHYLIKACSPLEDSLTASGKGYGMLPEIVNTYDEELADRAFRALKTAGVSVTPTLHIMRTLDEIVDIDHATDAMLTYIGPGIQKTYAGRVEGARRAKARGSDLYGQLYRTGQRMIQPMLEAGVNVMAGSDCGPFNSFVYPGVSLHEELEEMVRAGLTPAQALRTSVVNGPAFFELDMAYGIGAGKVADLIIVEENPLEDIGNLSAIRGVMVRGKYYDHAALQEMLDQISNK